MPTVVVASTKGGAGKTTTVIGMALAFAENNISVAILDADPQQHLEMFVRQWARADKSEIEEGERTMSYKGVVVVRDVDEFSVVDDIARMSDACDVVLVDLQGSANTAMFKAMTQADLVIIPVQVSRFDAHAVMRTSNQTASAAKVMRRRIPVRLLLTRTPTAIRSKALNVLRKEFEEGNYRFLRTELMERPIVQKMTIDGLVPRRTSDISSERNAAENFHALAAEVSLILQGKEVEPTITREAV